MTTAIQGVLIRERRLEDDVSIVDIRNEANTNWPPITLESYRFQADPTLIPEGGIQDRFVAEVEGEVVAVYALGGNWGRKRPNTFSGNLGVKRAFRGRGIGTAMYDHMMERARTHGAERIYGNVVEGQADAYRFVTSRGYEPTDRVQRMSRLPVADADLTGYEAVDKRLAAEGIRIAQLAEVAQDDAFLRRLHDMEYDAGQDIPSSEEWEQDPFELWKRWVFEAPGRSAEHFWVAVHGEDPIGEAVLVRHSPTVMSNGLTATVRAFRGKGVARALKKHQIDWAREQDIEYIYTGNDVDNQRMLAINIRLGYQPVPNLVELLKEL